MGATNLLEELPTAQLFDGATRKVIMRKDLTRKVLQMENPKTPRPILS